MPAAEKFYIAADGDDNDDNYIDIDINMDDMDNGQQQNSFSV